MTDTQANARLPQGAPDQADRPAPSSVAFWFPEDQSERLLELLGNDPQSKETPLRRDVRLLGMLLGDILREQCGETVFGVVERLRDLLIQNRSEVETAGRGAGT